MAGTFSRSLIVVYTANGLNGLLSAIAVPLAIRTMGLSGYGLFSIYLLLVSYNMLADLGVGKNLLRLLAQGGPAETREHHLRVAAGLYVVLCGAWLVASPLLALAVPRYIFPVEARFMAAVRWMVVLSVLEFAAGVPISLMQTACVAAQRFDAYARFTFVSGLLRNGAILSAAVVFRDPIAVAAVLVARKTIELPLAAKLLGGLPAAGCRPLFDVRRFRGMLGQSTSLAAAQLLNCTVMGVGSPLVNAVFGLEALGIYRAAFDLAGKITFISNGIGLVVFPRAARYFSSSAADTAPRLPAILHASVAMYTSLVAITVIAGPHVLSATGLTQTTVQLFALLSVAMGLNAHSLLGNELIQAAGRYGRSICYGACALLAQIAIFLIMDRRAGTMAIGWAWIGAALISACVSDALTLTLSNTARFDQVRSIAVKCAAVCACVGLVLYVFGAVSAIPAVLCGLMIAALLLFALRVVMPLLHTGEPKRVPAEPIAPIYV